MNTSGPVLEESGELRTRTRGNCTEGRNNHLMEKVNAESFDQRIQCNDRRCIVSSFSVDLLEILCKKPRMHVLFIPGNPGIVSYYREFIEALYENLGGNASITAIGHTGQGRKVASGRYFSLKEQIDHKVDFIEQEMSTSEVPVVLVGHSLGTYIGLEVFKKVEQKVKIYVGLYPFLMLNNKSSSQPVIGMVARSSVLSGAVSLLLSLIGSLPTCISERVVKRLIGQSWSFEAINATCIHLFEYHTMRNVLYLTMTEFRELSEEPDWGFMRQKKDQITFLFGDDDHWGPLTHFDEISSHVPGIDLYVEREGFTHSFSCSTAGSEWVARYVSDVIRNKIGVELNK